MVGSTADRLLALRNNQKRMHGHLPPPLLDARGRMLPEEIQKRTTTSQASKLLRLGRDHEILVEVSQRRSFATNVIVCRPGQAFPLRTLT
jgi:hypothetical protein